ncbi:XrtA/PEP-CTERM system TPR-repeat protein PrsT [Pseudomaricurvus sp. HS19]|uniref:XrtA/PEP-CTERM system TPR-repeat protein PrsT n=1 Tax=Pseudomaricurvus sp. HS19 TaxID=2692626 RepID=UPI001370D657|nr:XrtA/PEP-CTERM system TPR-repeat protein PrsT [Pseudomaricurvus sp. HS19]MYM62008.1 PEP-CTERM system TPR-repeat protein PrsT [Pseudomaricurvus sp. HS19]
MKGRPGFKSTCTTEPTYSPGFYPLYWSNRRSPAQIKAVFFLLVLLLACIISGCQGNRDPDIMFSEAQQSIDAGDVDSAIIQLKVILQEYPGHLPSRIQIGKLYRTSGDPQSAQKELEYALEHDGDKSVIVPPLMAAYINLGKFEKAVNLPVEGLSGEDLAITYAFQAQAYELLGQRDDAQRILAKANELSPNSPEVKTTTATFSLEQDRTRATQLLKEVVEQNPAYANAWRNLGAIYHADDNLDKADEAYSEVIKLNPNAVTYLRRAYLRIKNNDFESAQKDVDMARKTVPNYYEVDFLQGLIFAGQNKQAEAQNYFLQTYSKKSDFLPGLYYLALNSFLLGQFDTALDLAETYFQESKQALPGRILLSQLYLRNRDFNRVIELLEDTLKAEPDNVQIIATLADGYHGIGRYNDELRLLNKLTDLNGDVDFLQYRRVLAQLRGGQGKEGLAQAKSILADNPGNWNVSKAVIQYHSVNGAYGQALQQAQDFADHNPDSVQAFNMLGVAELQIKHYASAKTSFSKALELAPGNIGVLHNLALVALYENDKESAKSYYRQALAIDKTHLKTLLLLAAQEQMDSPENYVKHLELAIASHPDASQPRYLLARFYMNRQQTDKVLTTLGQVDVFNNFNRETALLLADYYLSTGDTIQADRYVDLVLNKNRKDIDALFLKAQVEQAKGNPKKAHALISEVLILNPNYLLAQLAHIDEITRQGELSEAESYTTNALKTYPNNPHLLLRLGKIQQAQGQLPEARSSLLQAYKNAPSTTTLGAYASVLYDTEPESSLQLLESWLNKNPRDLRLRLLLANLYLKTDQTRKAAKHYIQALEVDANNLLALNNLAWLYRQKEPEQALEYARRATRLQAESPALLDTLAVVLMYNKRNEKALQTIDEAIRISGSGSGDSSLLFHKAQILDAMGNKQESRTILSALLASNQDFPEKGDAEALLKRL